MVKRTASAAARGQQKHGEEDGIFICNLVNWLAAEAWQRTANIL